MSKNEEEKSAVQMSGYLEKKGNKMKMMSSWKLKWFVLKGRLLLYYRSKDEYEALSPCKGSINLGPTCTVKPLLGTTCVFQIETRARTIVLKAKSRLEHEKWLQAILSVLNQNAITPTTGIAHFRYSSDDLAPRHLKDTQNRLTRQNTMPKHQKVEKRRTFCGSFENVLETERANGKPKFSSTQDVSCRRIYGAIGKCARRSEEVVNDLYDAIDKDDEEAKLLDLKGKSSDNLYCRIPLDFEDSRKSSIVENETYITERKVPKENIYSKITADYVTQTEMDAIERQVKEVMVENDQYCTAAIRVMETKETKYHEYNLPQKDNIYSIPNVDQNENRIPKHDDLGPYSVCNIYPKKPKVQEAIYDNPLEVLGKEPKSQVKADEIVKKVDEERKPQLPKKMSFLKKFFKLKNRKKSEDNMENTKTIKEETMEDNRTSDGDLISKNVLEELQKLLIAKKQSLQQSQVELLKSDSQLATKRMLEELQKLLINKKDNLKHLMNTVDTPSVPQKYEDSIYQEISEIQLKKVNADDKAGEHAYENTSYTSLHKIDKILNDLDSMKKTSKPYTTSKVKSIIAKFNSLDISNIKEPDDEEPVILREKNKVEQEEFSFANSKNSADELNLLLSELAKVTNAPILTPGVTSSLDVSPLKHEEEFQPADKLKRRRHSDPDYDIPRPHTNLNIVKTEVEADDTFVATRFFGPVLSNYESINTPTPTSITPDSLEVTPCTSEVSSYHSHAYTKNKQKPYYLHAQPKGADSENKETFVDSLDIETTTAL